MRAKTCSPTLSLPSIECAHARSHITLWFPTKTAMAVGVWHLYKCMTISLNHLELEVKDDNTLLSCWRPADLSRLLLVNSVAFNFNGNLDEGWHQKFSWVAKVHEQKHY